METEITLLLAFGAGALSFLSPCTLPLLPVYLSYITGKSVNQVKEDNSKEFRRILLLNSVSFLVGVSIIYISLGLSITYLGNLLGDLMTGSNAILLQRIAGILIIVLGLIVSGWIHIPFFHGGGKRQGTKKSASLLSSFLVGLGFAAGWTPCTGPIFSGIVLIGVSTGSTPIGMLIAYIIGFALPFLLLSFFISKLDFILKYSERLMKIGGIVMIIMGLLLLSGQLEFLSNKLSLLLENTPFSKLG